MRILERNRAQFDDFYKELLPGLVDFVARMGITPSQFVLKLAPEYLSPLSDALSDLLVEGDENRDWLIVRVAWFIGEFFVQKYGGAWYVDGAGESPTFAKYVVGDFGLDAANLRIRVDPFQYAIEFVCSPPPRSLKDFIEGVERDLEPSAAGNIMFSYTLS